MVKEVIVRNRDIFFWGEIDIGYVIIVKYRIEMMDNIFFRQCYR